jgi:5,10-methylenetetrahydromethanopterin reductase
MANPVHFSVGLSGDKPMRDYVELAQLAERQGFHTVTVADDLMFKPVWPILSVIAQNTRTIRVGPSVTNPYLVHPAILAGNAALLDEISDGRAYLGIGKGAFLEFLGVEQPRPLATVREALELIRRFLSGDRSPYDGTVFRATDAAFFRWEPPRAAIPLLVGTWGPRMCEVAGELADEVKAAATWSPDYVRVLREHIGAGEQRAGRPVGTVQLCVGPLSSISEDGAAAKAAARGTLAVYLPYLSPMPESVGIEPEELQRVKAAADQGDYEGAAAQLSDLSVDSFSLSGTPDDFVRAIETLLDQIQVDRIEFGTHHSPKEAEAIRLLGERVLPHFS